MKGLMMSKIIVMQVEELTEIINKAMLNALKESLPELLEKATRKPYLTRQELMDLTGWSSRTLQHLRDTEQIPFVQHGHKIIYPTKGIYTIFEEHQILPRK